MVDRPLTLYDARNILGRYVVGGGVQEFDSLLNQAVERIHDMGNWPALLSEVELADEVADGILTLPQDYEVMLAAQVNGVAVPIVDLTLEYSLSGPGNREAGVAGASQIVDLGQVLVGDDEDFKTYRRRYKVLFELSSADTLTGLVKQRFRPLSDDNDYIHPGNIGALKQALLAVNYEDEGDPERARTHWEACTEILDTAKAQSRQGVRQTAQMSVFGIGASKINGMF